jgi:hypothetical protein
MAAREGTLPIILTNTLKKQTFFATDGILARKYALFLAFCAIAYATVVYTLSPPFRFPIMLPALEIGILSYLDKIPIAPR